MKSHVAGSAPKADAPAADFRSRLQQELAGRCIRNPRYSLRAFAKFLGVDHATLSQQLRGKRRLTEATIRRLAVRLDLTHTETDSYAAAARLRPADTGPAKARELEQLTAEAATILADWKHLAILELVRLRDFRPDSPWIARVLGLTTDEVNIALQHLLRLGLLEMAAPGRWIDRLGDVSVTTESLARAAIGQLAARALALAAAGGAPHLQLSTTFAVSREQLAGLFRLAEAFQREVAAYLEDGPGDAVYRLDLSLFPLTQPT